MAKSATMLLPAQGFDFPLLGAVDFRKLRAMAAQDADGQNTSASKVEENRKHCHFCSKRFASLAHVIRHERVHTGERPFACDVCDRRFSQLGNLRTHRRRHAHCDAKAVITKDSCTRPDLTAATATPDAPSSTHKAVKAAAPARDHSARPAGKRSKTCSASADDTKATTKASDGLSILLQAIEHEGNSPSTSKSPSPNQAVVQDATAFASPTLPNLAAAAMMAAQQMASHSSTGTPFMAFPMPFPFFGPMSTSGFASLAAWNWGMNKQLPGTSSTAPSEDGTELSRPGSATAHNSDASKNPSPHPSDAITA
ncbi:uncharacterized protein MONBRDRAFT_32134 [Monosiga brevicollis MX1]|uniref:C2H2-type domain-containing protein n=1 Tax=Monosiga brevicollis TaxID=81824 RepID=A9UXV9_MONBE|nr:uncharacterized protein MONBRDRAFT_32134 [Monosiga brevicollis MX1]EDQ89754.1 predicted protein [Monosiga brevicollis MX1]|eukprot:XP_001745176.1 hypothetical protein [Monosiga brevicollis MX1]